MPTYEYKCSDCSYQFEELQSFTADPITVCPECSGKTERLITGGAGFLFKGSGFYITENRSSSYKADAAKDKTPASTPTPKAPEKKATPTPPKA